MAEQDDLRVEPEDAGALFRAEMALTDFVLRQWKAIGAAVVLFLLSVLAYGQYTNWYQAGQRRTTAAIADVESELPASLLALSAKKASKLGAEELDVAALADAAKDLVAAAEAGSGTSAIEGYLKAAELYRLAADATGRRAALEAAAAQADGVLGYAATAALANLDIEQGKTEEGLGRLRELARGTDYLAQQATLDLAAALEAVDRPAEAVATYDDYLSRWPEAKNVDDVRVRRDRADSGQGG